jgi:hypothetical protein
MYNTFSVVYLVSIMASDLLKQEFDVKQTLDEKGMNDKPTDQFQTKTLPFV